MNRIAYQELNGTLKHFIGEHQRSVIAELLSGEEGDHFADKIIGLAAMVKSMPKTYETDGQGGNAVVYLHYFKGAIDAWVTERDIGDSPRGDGLGPQIQAFGKVCLTGNPQDAEVGYIAIAELLQHNVDLDLYWEPKKLSDV